MEFRAGASVLVEGERDPQHVALAHIESVLEVRSILVLRFAGSETSTAFQVVALVDREGTIRDLSGQRLTLREVSGPAS